MKLKLLVLSCVAIALAILGIRFARQLSGPARESAELSAAITRAQGSLGHFRERLRTGADRAYFVRASFADASGHRETLWLKRVRIAGDGFAGIVDQDPAELKDLHRGDERTVTQPDVVDWTILHEDGSREGGFTVGLEPGH